MRLKLTREQKVAARYLASYRMVGDRMESATGALERAYTLREHIGATSSAMGGGGGVDSDRMANIIIMMDDAVAGLTKLSRSFADMYAQVEMFVTDVQKADEMAGKVLRLTYISGLTPEQIAEREDMGCSKKTVYECLRRGLDMAYDMLAG